MFSRKCVCKSNISKMLRPLLAALSVKGLSTVVHFYNLAVDFKGSGNCDQVGRLNVCWQTKFGSSYYSIFLCLNLWQI